MPAYRLPPIPRKVVICILTSTVKTGYPRPARICIPLRTGLGTSPSSFQKIDQPPIHSLKIILLGIQLSRYS